MPVHHTIRLLPVLLTTALMAQEPCDPISATPANGTDHTVARVQLHTLDHSTPQSFGQAWSDNAYRGDSSTTRLHRGTTYTLTVQSNTTAGTYHAAWLDWHAEPVGLWANELLPLGQNGSPHEMLTSSFTVPADAATGYRTLRVRAGSALDPADPCADGGIGETEDYAVVIEGDRCIPLLYNGTSSGDSISAVSLNGNTLALPAGRSAYKDMSAATIPVSAGAEHTLVITTGAYADNRVSVWADWDNDGDLDEEPALGHGMNTTPYEEVTIPFTVPGTLAHGSEVPLRVRLYYLSFNSGPCTDLYHGQTVDYLLQVQNSLAVGTLYATEAPRITVGPDGPVVITASAWTGARFSMLNATGSVVLTGQLSADRHTISAHTLVEGAYLVRVEGAPGTWTGRYMHLR